jgi:hypothetical protein
MTRDEVFISKYVKPGDLKGRPVVVEIAGATLEPFASGFGRRRRRNCRRRPRRSRHLRRCR